jgi:ribosomal protein L9
MYIVYINLKKPHILFRMDIRICGIQCPSAYMKIFAFKNTSYNDPKTQTSQIIKQRRETEKEKEKEKEKERKIKTKIQQSQIKMIIAFNRKLRLRCSILPQKTCEIYNAFEKLIAFFWAKKISFDISKMYLKIQNLFS